MTHLDVIFYFCFQSFKISIFRSEYHHIERFPESEINFETWNHPLTFELTQTQTNTSETKHVPRTGACISR